MSVRWLIRWLDVRLVGWRLGKIHYHAPIGAFVLAVSSYEHGIQ